MARFEREAQVLASLNHTNIGAVYGLEESAGQRAIVMELVEGPEVRGPLPVDEALQVARQVAEAMETAHERGIIHRDLKPANIKMTPDGVVKVLDFGLAKALEGVNESNAETRVTLSPTLPLGATQVGMVLGTAAYMSPEQAKGKTADRRADIWSFGVVLYELLTGRRLFDGETVAETLASVMKDPITLDGLPPGTPVAIRRLLQRCLERDVRRRLQSMGEARIAVEDAIGGGVNEQSATSAAPTAPKRRLVIPIALAALAALVGAGVTWALRPAPLPQPVGRFVEPLPDGVDFTNTGRQTLAVSRDGTKVAFTANNRVYLRTIGEVGARPLTGESARNHVAGIFAGRRMDRVLFPDRPGRERDSPDNVEPHSRRWRNGVADGRGCGAAGCDLGLGGHSDRPVRRRRQGPHGRWASGGDRSSWARRTGAPARIAAGP